MDALTTEQIDALTGKELDKAVAEHIWGLSDLEWREMEVTFFATFAAGWYGKGENGALCRAHQYSTDIDAAWKLVEKMCDQGHLLRVNEFLMTTGGDTSPRLYFVGFPDYPYSAVDANICVAICRAALKAVTAPQPA